jgi:hypothetical protein
VKDYDLYEANGIASNIDVPERGGRGEGAHHKGAKDDILQNGEESVGDFGKLKGQIAKIPIM